MVEIAIRALHTAEEMDAAVQLQKSYWGEEGESLVASHMLLSIANYGGHVLGAYDGERLVGVLMGFLGAEITPEDDAPARRSLLVMSKRMVVLPEYRSQKIGERLKQAQRDFALRHGIALVTWTFDPLLARNAYLNLHKLGAVGQGYQVNYFGANATHPTLSADRIVANWWVAHPHVEAVQAATHEAAMPFNATETAGDYIAPKRLGTFDAPELLFEVPADFPALTKQDAGLGAAWRAHVREGLQALFAAGYLATDVIRHDARTFYVFTLDDGTYTFREDTTA